LGDLIGICAIANNIAKVKNAVMRRRDCEARLQRFQVGMDVGQYQDAHT
jgi:hypothetical protein